MKKLLFVLAFVLLILNAVMVESAITDDLVASWSLNTNGKYEDSSPNSLNLSATGSPTFKTVAKVNGGYYLNGAGDSFTLANDASKTSLGKNFTFVFWTNSTDLSGGYLEKYVDGNNYIRFFTDGTYIFAQVKSGGTSCFWQTTNVSYANAGWKMLTFLYNYNTCANSKIYLNNETLSGLSPGGSDGVSSTNAANIILYNNAAGSNIYLEGTMDIVSLWNRSLTQADINTLYNLGVGVEYPFSYTPQPTLSLSNSLVNQTKYNNRTFNFTYSGSITNYDSDLMNCSFYQQDVLNQTLSGVNISRTNIYNITFPTMENYYTIQFNCSDGNVNATTQRYSYYIDTIHPDYVLTGLTNNSVYYKNITAGSFNYNISASDTNLFAVNYTLFMPNGSVVRNHFKDSISPPSYNNYTAVSLDNYPLGNYTLRIQLWDDHNPVNGPHEKAKAITKQPDKLHIEFSRDYFDISSQDTAGFEVYDENNKYRIEFAFAKRKGSLIVESGSSLVYRQSQHKAHLVLLGQEKYFDLDADEIRILDVQQLTATKYRISYESSADVVKTNSIGDLNSVLDYVYFNVSGSMAVFAKDTFTNNSIQNFTISVLNGSTMVASGSTTTGAVFFNLTGNYSTNFSSGSHANNNTGVVMFTSGGSLIYYVFATNSLYVFIYDEVTDTLITQNVTVKITNFNVSSTELSTSTGSVFQSGFQPGVYELRYGSEGYNTRSYYTTITASTSQQIELFLLNSSKATYVSFINNDETGNRYEGAYVKGLRHFTDCNCFKIVEMDLTNFNGIATLSLQQHEAKYRFVVEYQNQTVYVSSSAEGYKITDTSYTLPWTLLGDTMQSFFGTTGLYKSLTWNNDTKSFALTINDPTNLVNRFCIYVDELNSASSTGHQQICSNCMNASAGTLNCNVSSYVANGRELVAKGWIHTNTEYSEYWLDPLSVFTNLEPVVVLGTLGVFLGLIIILVVFFAGFVIGGMAGGIIAFDIGFVVVSMLKMIMVSYPVMLGVLAISVIVLLIVGER